MQVNVPCHVYYVMFILIWFSLWLFQILSSKDLCLMHLMHHSTPMIKCVEKKYTSTLSHSNFYNWNFKYLINFPKITQHLSNELWYISLRRLSSNLHQFSCKIDFYKILQFCQKKSSNLGWRIYTSLSAKKVQKWKLHFNQLLTLTNM